MAMRVVCINVVLILLVQNYGTDFPQKLLECQIYLYLKMPYVV